MSSAILGTGVLLARGDGTSPEVFTTVVEIRTIKPANRSRNEIDVSTHNAGVEEKILGMLRTGPVTGVCNWLPSDATHASTGTGMLADLIANTESNWRITFPDSPATVYTFLARVQMFDPSEITTDSPMEFNYSLTINGAITET